MSDLQPDRCHRMAQSLKEAIVTLLVTDDLANDVTVVLEDDADFDYDIARMVGELKLLVIITCTGWTRLTQSGSLVYGPVRFGIDILENVAMNRTSEDALTGQRLGIRLIQALHRTTPRDFINPALVDNFNRGERDGLALTAIQLTSSATLD